MDVDLALLPALDRYCTAAHDILNLERRSELWPDVRALDSSAMPNGVYCYLARGEEWDDRTYGLAMVDESGESDDTGNTLRFATAGNLLTLASHDGVTDNWRNRAAWAYLACLPPDWPVVLFWS